MGDRTVMQSGRYKAYPEYKGSGVEWLGEIPRHWGLLRGKWRFKSLKEVNRNLQCMDRLALTMRGVIERSIDSDDGLQPSAFTGYQIFEKDDLVFKLIDLENYKTSRVGLVFKKGIMSPAYIRLKPNKGMLSKFFYYFYFDLYLRGIYNQIGGQGVRSALNASDLLEIEICVPSREEQAEIADFLDYETAKIDTLIKKQQRLIELLTEKRQATISHAVTKGLNPDVPMKDSGVEWLGEVPAHWEVKDIKFQLKSLNSRRIPINSQDRGDREGIYRYYGASGVIDYIDDYIFDEPTVLVGEDGANLLSRSTPLAFSAHGKYWVNNHAHILEAKDGLADFWAEVIDIIDVTPLVTGSAQPKLTAEALSNLKIAFPPTIKERKEIESFIHSSKYKYGELIRYAKKAIQLMQERRTALISAAVTGKIDVRDWVKPE